MSTAARTVTEQSTLNLRQATPGFIEGTIFHDGPVVLDPFLALTDFQMSEPTFAPHPHAGFSAVTYMFRDSPGSFRNRDSLGDTSLITPGSLHWTQAASGMMHEEIPTNPGTMCHGLQLFVNLGADHKRAAPRALHVDADAVPVVPAAPGATVRVVVGDAFGAPTSLPDLLTPVTLLDIELDADAELTVPVADDHRALVMVVAGDLLIAGAALPVHTVAGLDGPGDHIAVHAGASGATLLLLAGRPLDEPVKFGGPFCMNTDDELRDARRRFQAGEMGALTPSF
jgi:redox-sensitive bicupin YhaK (pirin superfamily)